MRARGEWRKILKRFYRLAGCLRLRFLVGRAHADLMADPEAADHPQRGRQLSGGLDAHLDAVDLENQKAPGRLRAFRGFG